ncbi:BlaI/MecI/CopY family transcriptional regulator [Paraglaciecola aquimarina]|uniref:BlaI/MecI/CopY family transcriptional regulator n=1 Tax=Paraglaciecola algarum TaxID=3050085 RepID=A0ABS9D7F3_9ALTE|nr:BlaI/MecI/CopY family transcriptional regulator [Paraglaciecola sp. G1-23]MCF2948845.1 BlaI/MecI/CopY family transcriptional regulator [Paraglaciecola sp. G1-23]
MKLSNFELDVMQHFWQQTQCGAKHIHQEISLTKPVAYNTVKTIVDRLEEKGAIKRVGKDGRAILYQAAISQNDLTPSAVPSFIQRFFGGSASGLITHLIDDDKLSEKDIAYLEKYLQDKKASKDK